MESSKDFLNVLVPGDNPNIDIVAVHGLNPKGKENHAEKTWTKGEKLWLRDFLAPNYPNARIMLFGYNSNVINDANVMDIAHHAENLLNQLDFKRGADPDRPLVFVAHSLGGLVVKQALTEAKKVDYYSTIRSSTYGIAFFGTPHLGGNHAALGEILCNIVNFASRKTGNKLVRDLEKSSQFLAKLNEDFKHQKEDFYFVNFQESKSYGKLGLIVNPESATMGSGPPREFRVPLDADHNGICKFAAQDQAYEFVENNIGRLIRDAIQARAEGGLVLRRSPVFSFVEGGRPYSMRQTSSPALTPYTSPTLTPGAFRPSNNAVFKVPHGENFNFIGRQDIVQKVVNHLVSERSPYQVALYGLGGVGKTELATQCAYRIQKKRPDISVFWIQASSLEDSHRSILKIAEALQIPGTDAPNADVLGLIRDHLRTGQSGRWVMIIDNADDFESLSLPEEQDNITQFRLQSKRLLKDIPVGELGSVLITTRNKKIALRFAGPDGSEQVLPLEKEESRQLVQQSLGIQAHHNDGVDELTEVLGRFPLAITQATHFVRENGITVQKYLARFRENQHNALEIFSHGFSSDAATKTWMMSFQQLRQNSTHAADLFSMMAYLEHSNIPEQLLIDYDLTKTPLQFEEACGELKAFSFMSEADCTLPNTATSTTTMFNVQPIVQMVMRSWLEEHNESTRWADAALVAVTKVFPSAEVTVDWKMYEVYFPHAQAIVEFVRTRITQDSPSDIQKHKALLLHNLAWYMRIRGFHEDAATLAEEARNIRQRVLGDDDPVTLLSIHNLSCVLFEQGDIEQSKLLQISAHSISKQKLGDSHPDTLRAQSHLARILGSQKQYDDTFDLQQSTLTAYSTALGEDHPATLLAMRDLAISWNFKSNSEKAEELQKRVYQKLRAVLGSDHPDTLIVMNDLAITFVERNRHKEAEVLLNNILERSQRVLGQNHPHTIATYERLVNILRYRRNNADDEQRAQAITSSLRRVRRNWKTSLRESRSSKIPHSQRHMSTSIHTWSYKSTAAALAPATTTDPESSDDGLSDADLPASKPEYSENKLLRTMQKKYERTVSEEARDVILKQSTTIMKEGTFYLNSTRAALMEASTKVPWTIGAQNAKSDDIGEKEGGEGAVLERKTSTPQPFWARKRKESAAKEKEKAVEDGDSMTTVDTKEDKLEIPEAKDEKDEKADKRETQEESEGVVVGVLERRATNMQAFGAKNKKEPAAILQATEKQDCELLDVKETQEPGKNKEVEAEGEHTTETTEKSKSKSSKSFWGRKKKDGK